SAMLASATFAGVTIINLPTNLSCPDPKSPCYLVYQMRFNNKSVILPQQTKDIIAEYERNKRSELSLSKQLSKNTLPHSRKHHR
ncbi:MAG: hypothetical protein V7K82_20015, partial [Nostoc sp.]